MKRTALVVGLVVLISARPDGAPPQDALALLKSALGGEAALSGVLTIRARGTLPATPEKGYFDIAVALPDRFVKTVRTFPMQGASWSTRMEGYGRWEPGDAPQLYEGGVTPRVSVTRFDANTLAEFLLPLMGGTPSSSPVESRSEGHVITFHTPSGDRSWRLELDSVTHLPARMSWTSPLVPTARATGQPRHVQSDFSDFRPVGGVRWPHRIITRVDDVQAEVAIVDRYELNVRLSDKMFR